MGKSRDSLVKCMQVEIWHLASAYGNIIGMAALKLILILSACPMFLVAIATHIVVKLKLRPGDDSDFDEYHYEFEDHHPDFARYSKWSRITFITAEISALLLFIAIAI